MIKVKDHGTYFRLELREDMWFCHCGYFEQAQLPCYHVLRFVILKGLSILSYIPSRRQVEFVKSVKREQPKEEESGVQKEDFMIEKVNLNDFLYLG